MPAPVPAALNSKFKYRLAGEGAGLRDYSMDLFRFSINTIMFRISIQMPQPPSFFTGMPK